MACVCVGGELSEGEEFAVDGSWNLSLSCYKIYGKRHHHGMRQVR